MKGWGENRSRERRVAKGRACGVCDRNGWKGRSLLSRARLHEPAVVEADLGLREADRSELRFGQGCNRGQGLLVVIENVPKRDVVVADGLVGPVAAVWRVLRQHNRPEGL
eukprot:3686372-Pleurochrysis_carterae.AAC.1